MALVDRISRRDFVRAGGLTLLGAGLAACGKSKVRGPSNPNSLASIVAGRQQNVSIISVSGQLAARPDERFPFALFDLKTNERYSGGTARLWVAQDQTSAAIGPIDAKWAEEGLGDKGIYVARVPFAKDGSWLILVEAKAANNPATLLGGTQVGVGRRSQQPAPGDKAISVASPTTSDHRGVDPICTRKPPCSMHDLSLDRALKNGKPTVLIIGTPAFCESKVCGPVVDIIQAVKKELGTARANFVHVEVYKDNRDAPAKRLLAPAAAAWKLEFEPATYFIKADGTIVEWYIGPASHDEVREQTRALMG